MPIVTPKKDVFISYARKDGRDFASELRTDFETEHGLSVWQDVVSMAGGENWWQQIREAIEGVHTMLVVLTPAALESPVIKQEWAHARKVGTNIIPVTTDLDFYKNAPAWLSRVHGYNFNPTLPDYAASYAAVIKALNKPPTPTPQPIMLPWLSEQFAARPREQAEILTQLLDEAHVEPRAGVVTLWGEMGFGKTTLAVAAAFEHSVIDAFDGVLYAEIGESATNITDQINEMIKDLGGNPTEAKSVNRRLRELLERRVCLILFDDVWDESLIEPYLDIEGCTYLITTRDPAIAALTTTAPIRIREMDTQEAVRLLENYIPDDKRPNSEIEHVLLRELAVRLGEWALILDSAGRDIRAEISQGSSLVAAVKWVNDGLNEHGLGPDSDFATKLKAKISTSLRRFTVDENQRLFELSIFRDDVDVPEDVAVKLWSRTQSTLREREARKLIRRFAGHFFLRDARNDQPMIRFHDALREYLAGKLGNVAGIASHNALLEAYAESSNAWHTLAQDDPYLRDQLVYHLIGAGREADVHALFDNTDWRHVRFEGSGYTYTGYIDDLMQGWALAQAETERQINADNEPAAFAQCLRYALIRTSINSLAASYPPELVARAVELGVWSVERALSVAANVPDFQHRLGLYILLISSQALNQETENRVQSLMLELTQSISEDQHRASAIRIIGLHLSAENMEKVLTLIEDFRDDFNRTYSLEALVSNLPAHLTERALTIVAGIEHEYNQAQCLSSLIPYLLSEQLIRALIMIEKISDPYWRAIGLSELAIRSLEIHQRGAIESALMTIEQIDHAPNAAHMLFDFATRLPTNLMGETLTIMAKMKNDYQFIVLFSNLGPRLPPDLINQALTLVDKTSNAYYQVLMLSGLKVTIPKELLNKAVKILENIENEYEYIRAIGELAQRLPPEDRKEVLAQGLLWLEKIEEDQMLSVASLYLDSYLPEELVKQVTTIVKRIKDPHSRAIELIYLIPFAVEEKREIILDVLSIVDTLDPKQHGFANILKHLAVYLPEELVERVLNLIHRIDNDYSHLETWIVLVFTLPLDKQDTYLKDIFLFVEETQSYHTLAEIVKVRVNSIDSEVTKYILDNMAISQDNNLSTNALIIIFGSSVLNKQNQIFTEILTRLRKMQNDTVLLSSLAKRIPSRFVMQYLDFVRATENDGVRISVLNVLAPRLPSDIQLQVLSDLIEVSEKIDSKSIQSSALTKFALHLPPIAKCETLFRAIELTKDTGYERIQADLLVEIVPYVPPELLPHILRIANKIGLPDCKSIVLSEVAAHFPKSERITIRKRALSVVSKIQNPSERAKALIRLAPQLLPSMITQAVVLAEAITNDRLRVDTTRILSHYVIPQEQTTALNKVFETVQTIEEPYDYAQALVGFINTSIHEDHSIASKVRHALLLAMRSSVDQERGKLFEMLDEESLFAPPIFAAETLGAIAEHIIDICDWMWE
jgi:hypothetical protein